MAKVNIKLNGHEYAVACDPGEEARLQEVVNFMEKKMQQVAERAGGSSVSETRLMLLTALTMADELSEQRRGRDLTRRAEEDIMVAAVQHLSQRINRIAELVGHA